MERTNYKNIINDIETFVLDHHQLEDFIYGDFETCSEDYKYPAVFVKPNAVNVEGNISQIGLVIYFAGLQELDGSNNLDLTNNLNIYAQDFLAYFWDKLEDNGSIDFVVNKTDDNLIAAMLTATFDVKSYACYTPLNPYHNTLTCSSSATTISVYGGESIVTVWGEGGTSPYQNVGDFTVTAGTYNYTIFDADGYEAETSIEVTQPTKLIIAASVTIPELPTEFTFDSDISINGGTPEYISTELELNDGATLLAHNVVGQTDLSYVLADNLITLTNIDIDSGSSASHGTMRWYQDDDMIEDGEEYTLTFDYNLVSGTIPKWYYRFGGYPNNFSGQFFNEFTDITGTFTNTYTHTGTEVLHMFQFYFPSAPDFVFEITNLKVTKVVTTPLYNFEKLYSCFYPNANYAISNSGGSTGVVTWDWDTEQKVNFTNSTTTTSTEHPRLYFDNIIEALGDCNYRLQFHYKKNSGVIPEMIFRLGTTTSTNYVRFTLPDEEGDIDIEYVCIGLPSLNYSSFYAYNTTNNVPFDIDISDYKLTRIVQVEDTFTQTYPFGTFDLVATDASLQTATTQLELAQPIPDDRLQIYASSTPDAMLETNGNLYFPGVAGEYGYINWGDGSPLEKVLTSSLHIRAHHQYIEEGMKNISVYGDGIDGMYTASYQSPTYFKPAWINQFSGRNLLRWYSYYNSFFIGSFDEIVDVTFTYFYYYYAIISFGDINTMNGGPYKRWYNVSLNTNFKDYNYQPKNYGDVGTFLKGYSRNGYYYTSYAHLYRTGNFTYLDRIDGDIRIAGGFMLRGHNAAQSNWAMNDANQLAQLIVDINNNYVVNVPPKIDIRYNVSPLLADEPLRSEYIVARDALVLAGCVFTSS